MPSLLDYIDRFSYTAKEIQTSARSAAAVPKGPFTSAVLNTQLGDLARDIDSSELGLFTLVPPPSSHTYSLDNDATIASRSEIARVEFPGATPLRKPTGGRRVGNDPLREKEPEVYAEAALKYLDRYQSIRPMPRARQEIESIIERLGILRENVQSLKALEQSGETGTLPPKSSANDEERRIQELQSKIRQLKARKEVALRRQRTPDDSLSSTTSSQLDSQAAMRPTKFKSKLRPPSRTSFVPIPDEKEETFWSASSSVRRTKGRPSVLFPLGDGDNSLLMDSHVDFGDMSSGSLADIVISPPLPSSVTQSTSQDAPSSPLVRAQLDTKALLGKQSEGHEINEDVGGQDVTQENVSDDEAEKTVMLRKPPILSSSLTSTAHPRTATSDEVFQPSIAPPTLPEQVPGTPGNRTEDPSSVTPGTGKRSRIRITSETERIVSKIWSSVGDIIMPGHPFNTANAATSNKPPRAKETIALLENISSQVPSPMSPSTHSTLSLTVDPVKPKQPGLSLPTAIQILTAHLLFTLLSSPPKYSMPLAKVKAALTSKGIGNSPGIGSLSGLGIGLSGQGPETRALYGCVAKRLLKIDRRDREQVVKFDI